MSDLSRRELLKTAVAVPLLSAVGRQAPDRLPTLPDIRKAPCRVVGSEGAASLVVTREWDERNFCRSRISNPTSRPVVVKEVVLFEVSLRTVPPTALLYGEGFQMLTQTAGTIAAPVNAGSYTDAAHYKIPNAIGATTFYGLMKISGRSEERRGGK